MDKAWYRGVIKYPQKKVFSRKDIHSDMVTALGNDISSLSTVQTWTVAFRRGGKSLEDDPKSKRDWMITFPILLI